MLETIPIDKLDVIPGVAEQSAQAIQLTMCVCVWGGGGAH